MAHDDLVEIVLHTDVPRPAPARSPGCEVARGHYDADAVRWRGGPSRCDADRMTAPPSEPDKRPEPATWAGAQAGEAVDEPKEAEGPEAAAKESFAAEQRRRAAQLEESSYRQMQRARHMAAEAHDKAAAGHDRSARLHDRLADLGWGDVEQHRERAHEHREDAEAERARAEPDPDAPKEPTKRPDDWPNHHPS